MQPNTLSGIPLGSFTGTLVGLFQKGIRYSTVIDVGCADGHFYVQHFGLGRVRPWALWDKAQNRQIVQLQHDRRRAVLKQLAAMLADLRAARKRR